MGGYEDGFIKKAGKSSKRMSTFDTRANHLEMENKREVSVKYLHVSPGQMQFEKGYVCKGDVEGMSILTLGRCLTSQESDIPSVCIPAWVLGVTHHLAQLSPAKPRFLFWQKTPNSLLPLSCLCLVARVSAERPGRQYLFRFGFAQPFPWDPGDLFVLT